MSALSDQSRSGGRLVLPVGGQLAGTLVVAGQAVDARLDENEAELGVLVLAVDLEVLAHVHGLLDQVVQVLRDVWCQTLGLEDAEDLVARQRLDVGNTLGVPKPDTCAQSQDARSVKDHIKMAHQDSPRRPRSPRP